MTIPGELAALQLLRTGAPFGLETDFRNFFEALLLLSAARNM